MENKKIEFTELKVKYIFGFIPWYYTEKIDISHFTLDEQIKLILREH